MQASITLSRPWPVLFYRTQCLLRVVCFMLCSVVPVPLCLVANAADVLGIAIFEATERTFYNIFFLYPVLFVLCIWLITPFIRPFTFSRMFWTYCVPALPLMYVWDTTISCLRTYSVDELKELTSKLHGTENYVWEIGVQRPKLFFLPALAYCIGYPKAAVKKNM